MPPDPPDLEGEAELVLAHDSAQRALALVGTLQRRMVQATYELHEAAERVVGMYERRLQDRPDHPDAESSEVRAKYWRTASEAALRLSQEWESGPPGSDRGPALVTGRAQVIDLTVSGQAAQIDRAGTRLAVTVVSALYDSSLELHAALSMAPDPLVARRLSRAEEIIDECIREIRGVVTELRG